MLYLTPNSGDLGALEIIIFRIIQAIGGSFILANSFAIIADNFEESERAFAISLNSVASVSGVSIGIVIGGILSVIYWRDVFLISVPLGAFGTVWSYAKLKESSPRRDHKIDIVGNLLMASGMIVILLGVTYGITPYGASIMGWGNPLVLLSIIGGSALLVIFVLWERKANNPMLDLHMFRFRNFSIGSITGFISAMSIMGLLYMLTLLFQGIWLPLHGYSFSITPLWAGIYMLPMTISMGVFGVVAGKLSNKTRIKWFTVFGLILSGMSLFFLSLLPYNFKYYQMMIMLVIFGMGYGLFNSPNIASVMSSVPPQDRGSASGMLNNMRNTGYVASMGVFFSILISGLSSNLPASLSNALNKAGASSVSGTVSKMPPSVAIFGSFLGINPVSHFIPPVNNLSSSTISLIEGNTWFSQAFSMPFMSSLDTVYYVSGAIAIVAGLISVLRTNRIDEIPSSKLYGEDSKQETKDNKQDHNPKR